MYKAQYNKWLYKKGLHPTQIRIKKKVLGSPNQIPSYIVKETGKLSNGIGNGTKSPDMSKANFAKKNYAMAPAYNKGPIMVISKEDIIYAGKK